MSSPGSAAVTARIAEFGGWRSAMLARVRDLVLDAVPDVEEELKWRGTPVWSSNGILCTGEVYKDKVKLTFAHGAALKDSKKLFNASLDGGTRRAIDLRDGELLDAAAFKVLVRAAAAHNAARKGSGGP